MPACTSRVATLTRIFVYCSRLIWLLLYNSGEITCPLHGPEACTDSDRLCLLMVIEVAEHGCKRSWEQLKEGFGESPRTTEIGLCYVRLHGHQLERVADAGGE